MITCKGWFIISVFAAAVACNWATSAEPKIETLLSAKTFTPGERVRLEVRFHAGTDLAGESAPHLNDTLLSTHPNLKVLTQTERTEADTQIWTYELTAYNPGELRIPPFEVEWKSQSLSTEAIPVSVQSSRASDDFEMRPDAPGLNLPPRWTWILLGALAAAFSALTAYLLARLKRKKVPEPSTEPVRLNEEDPAEWLKKELVALRARWTASPNSAQLNELHGLLRRYLARRMGKPVESWTPGELRRRGSRNTEVQNFLPLLEEYDEIRFRPEMQDELTELVGPFLDRSEKTISTCGT